MLSANQALEHASEEERILFRDRKPLPADAVVGVTHEGIQLAGTLETVSWDRVAVVPLDAIDAGVATTDIVKIDAESINRNLQIGADLWRASHRLHRGHALFAEAMIDVHEEELIAQTGATPAAVHRALFEARLRRGATGLALRSWLAWAYAEDLTPDALGRRSIAAGERSEEDWERTVGERSFSRLSGPYGLVPVLPPVPMLRGHDDPDPLASFALSTVRSVPTDIPASRQRALVLARLYAEIDRVERGQVPIGAEALADIRAALDTDRGVTLAADMVFARVGTDQERSRARARLRSRMPAEVGGWVEAWCRLGLGWSMVNEGDPDVRALGVIELLHVPARFADREPYLAGLGLAAASVALERLDDPGAARLASILREEYGGHPVLSFELVRDVLTRLEKDQAERDQFEREQEDRL